MEIQKVCKACGGTDLELIGSMISNGYGNEEVIEKLYKNIFYRIIKKPYKMILKRSDQEYKIYQCRKCRMLSREWVDGYVYTTREEYIKEWRN